MTSIDHTTPVSELQRYLGKRGWLNASENIMLVETPGEGNMNVVLRIKTDQRSFIVKQSRPFVQKYKNIAAPVNRIVVEKNFYQAVRDNAVNAHIPTILGFDAEENLLLLEDLGHCEDMISIS